MEKKAKSLEVTRLKGFFKVKVGPGEGARVLQGVRDGCIFVDLCVVSPPGAPKILIPDSKGITKLRLLDGKKMEVLEEIEIGEQI